MLLGDKELRSFHIIKPWTRQLSLEEGEEALESWYYEADTPPLDAPPNLSKPATEALGNLFAVIPSEEATFDYSMWVRVTSLTDSYIQLRGSLSVASHAYTAKWRKERGANRIET